MKEWIRDALNVERYHSDQLRKDRKHTTIKTAKGMKRSIGSISESLTIARWLRTHSHTLEKFHYKHEAINYIRDKKYELMSGEN